MPKRTLSPAGKKRKRQRIQGAKAKSIERAFQCKQTFSQTGNETHWDFLLSWFVFVRDIAILRLVCKAWSQRKWREMSLKLQTYKAYMEAKQFPFSPLFFIHTTILHVYYHTSGREDARKCIYKRRFFLHMLEYVSLDVTRLFLHFIYTQYDHSPWEDAKLPLHLFTKCKSLTLEDNTFVIETFPPHLEHLRILSEDNGHTQFPPCDVQIPYSEETDYCGNKQWDNAKTITLYLKDADIHTSLQVAGVPAVFYRPNVFLSHRKKIISAASIGVKCKCEPCKKTVIDM
jgi:hypothetical protein